MERRLKGGGGGGGGQPGQGPIGLGGSGGGGQQIGIELAGYMLRLTERIRSRWTNPLQVQGLVAIVRFDIAPDGTVSNVQVVQSSGNAAYDQSAARAVMLANPVPAPPAGQAAPLADGVQIEFHSEGTVGAG
jgi:TolA protein